jgi:hypothetical protein
MARLIQRLIEEIVAEGAVTIVEATVVEETIVIEPTAIVAIGILTTGRSEEKTIELQASKMIARMVATIEEGTIGEAAAAVMIVGHETMTETVSAMRKTSKQELSLIFGSSNIFFLGTLLSTERIPRRKIIRRQVTRSQMEAK